MGIPDVFPVAKTGIVATIGRGAPSVALRADIDARPIHEDSGVAVPSKIPGVMHACGHDGHMAMLLGAARLLKEAEGEGALLGTVKLLFQPAEEGGAGADLMVKEGALEGVKAAFGLHLWPALPTGVVGTRPGTILAGSILFQAKIIGAGGHGAMPHLTRDPVVAAASAVTALQTLVSRGTSPFASAVVSVTKLWTEGPAFNVIPDEAVFGGTVRVSTDDDMARMRPHMERLIKSQAESFGCTAEVDWMEAAHPYYPPVVNDAATAAFVSDVATDMLGAGAVVRDVEGTMAGEDFAFFARQVPAAFAFLGIRNESAGAVHGLHTAQYVMDESALKVGAALHATLAARWLQQAASSGDDVKDEL